VTVYDKKDGWNLANANYRSGRDGPDAAFGAAGPP
jgi:hypothetical protein